MDPPPYRPLGVATAPDHGFADQAHLARELRAFSGLTPTSLIAGVRDR